MCIRDSYGFVSGLEVRPSDERDKPGVKDWVPASIFSQRLSGGERVAVVETESDALMLSLNERGGIDFDYMSEALNQPAADIRTALAEQRSIFYNPERQEWVPRDRYLSGRVRDKLAKAEEELAEGNQSMAPNVAALREVQPAGVPFEEINVRMGAHWVDEDYINEWVSENLNPTNRGRKYYVYDETLGEWLENVEPTFTDVRNAEWGTEKKGLSDLILDKLQSKKIEVKVKDPTDPKGKRTLTDAVASKAASEKAALIEQDFQKWLAEDEGRRGAITEEYNRRFNDTVPPTYDGSHQTFPGMSRLWQGRMRPHQQDAIYRVVSDGTALLAHEVGFGKTAVMVASAMERRRLGLADKSMFVLPKPIHAQFIKEFREIYPNARILSTPPGESSSKEDKARFVSNIRTGDWDAIILTGDQFKAIPINPKTERRWIIKEVEQLEDALEGMDEKSISGKELTKALERREVKAKKLLHKINLHRGKDIEYFDDLGVDQLYVDEAHRYKNLFFDTEMAGMKGLPRSDSQRSQDMMIKARMTQGYKFDSADENPAENWKGFAQNGVVFATGTPIANSVAEAWTMMRYLQEPELKRRGLHHFDAWANTYGNISEGMRYRPRARTDSPSDSASLATCPSYRRCFRTWPTFGWRRKSRVWQRFARAWWTMMASRPVSLKNRPTTRRCGSTWRTCRSERRKSPAGK